MIKEKLDNMKKTKIKEKLNISTRTLYNWENDLHVENIMKYIELLKILEIDPIEKLKEYKQKKEES